MEEKLTAHFEKLLKARLAELDQLNAGAEERTKPVTLDQTSVGRLSRMDALQVQALNLETQRRREVERKRIGAALKRIESDDYGFCAKCDEDIEQARLEIDPATPNCKSCAL